METNSSFKKTEFRKFLVPIQSYRVKNLNNLPVYKLLEIRLLSPKKVVELKSVKLLLNVSNESR